MFENLELSTVVTIILGLVTTFAGGFWLKAKGKIGEVISLGREAFDLLTKLESALEDDKITKAEITDLKKEASEVKKAWIKLIEKKSQ